MSDLIDERDCRECGTTFQPGHPSIKECGDCRRQAPPPEQARQSLQEHECENCERTFEAHGDRDLCSSCAEARAFSGIEAPEDGWEKYSDMDML